MSLAQSAAFAGMLESQSLYTVQIFLLLSFYMLAAGRRDAVFMYLGIAARAAVVIKLGAEHQSQSHFPGSLVERYPSPSRAITNALLTEIGGAHGRA